MEDATTQTEPFVSFVQLPIKRTPASHRSVFSLICMSYVFLFSVCFVCKEMDSVPMKVLSDDQRKLVFVKLGVFVPPKSRCCRYHFFNQHLSYEALRMIDGSIADVINLDSDGVTNLLNDCYAIVQRTKSFDFDDPSALKSDAYYQMTGLEKSKSSLNI